MTMEPNEGERRLTPVTAQNPGTERAHETHDRLLVARFALGDALAPDEAATVRALLATCAACDAVGDELRLVQEATATSLAPRRPRGFLITPEQARTLRPNAWQRFLGRLSAPRMTVLRPVAGATLAIGIVLVGASAVVPRGSQVAVPEAAPVANGTFGTDSSAGSMMADSSPAADGRQADPLAKASSWPGAESMPMGSPPALRIRLAPQTPDADASLTAYGAAASIAPDAPDDPAADMMVTSAETRPADTAGPALMLLGLLLAVVSTLVLVLAWLARRTVDPLLR
jgi:hypothetical protein